MTLSTQTTSNLTFDLFQQHMQMIPAFIDYLEEFYGAGGIYDMGATRAQLYDATIYYLSDTEHPFEGDSFDREQVRAILESRFGLSEIDIPDPYPVPESHGVFKMKFVKEGEDA